MSHHALDLTTEEARIVEEARRAERSLTVLEPARLGLLQGLENDTLVLCTLLGAFPNEPFRLTRLTVRAIVLSSAERTVATSRGRRFRRPRCDL
jgi:hypothetical protein